MDYQKLIIPIRGRTVRAIYRENTIPTYVGNPLIEALPRILSTKEAMKKLAHYPDYSESMRKMPDEERYHMLEDIVRFLRRLIFTLTWNAVYLVSFAQAILSEIR